MLEAKVDWLADNALVVSEKANQRLKEMGVQRMITSINIDYRLDKEISIESKFRATSG